MTQRSDAPATRMLRSILATTGPIRMDVHEDGAAALARPAWILCRNRGQFPITDQNTLLHWTRQGRVRPSDYLVDPRLDRCVQAKDLHALEVIFSRTQVRRAACLSRRFALASLGLMWVAPVAGSLSLLTAVVMALICLGEES